VECALWKRVGAIVRGVWGHWEGKMGAPRHGVDAVYPHVGVR
jgi:hypothetical protein